MGSLVNWTLSYLRSCVGPVELAQIFSSRCEFYRHCVCIDALGEVTRRRNVRFQYDCSTRGRTSFSGSEMTRARGVGLRLFSRIGLVRRGNGALGLLQCVLEAPDVARGLLLIDDGEFISV
jgi:hypothetical protein